MMRHMNDSGPMMPMYFFFGFQDSLLFKTWNLNTAGDLVGAIIVVMILAILYEGLKTGREWLENLPSVLTRSTSTEKLLNDEKKVRSLKSGLEKYLKQYIKPIHLVQSALHVVQVGISYLLMLVAMTYNGWLFLAVCIGAGLGYFIFGVFRKTFSNDKNEHCH